MMLAIQKVLLSCPVGFYSFFLFFILFLFLFFLGLYFCDKMDVLDIDLKKESIVLSGSIFFYFFKKTVTHFG